MKAMKKLIAILLCLAMIPCTFLTVFAAGEVNEVNAVGTVIASKTFDGDNISDCTPNNSNRTPTISKDTGYLSFISSDTKWTMLEMANGVVGNENDFSIQITFRWTSGATGNDTVVFGAYGCDYGLKYNGKIQNFDADNADISDTGEIGESLNGAWKVPDGEAYGPWVTATLVISEHTNSDESKTAGASAFVVNVEEKDFNKTIEYGGNVTDVRTKDKSGKSVTPDKELYTGGNSNYFEISDFRAISNGNILSSKTFDGDNVNGCALYNTTTPSISTETGHLVTGGSAWHSVEIADSATMAKYSTYSIQTTFRFNGYDSNSNCGAYLGAYYCDYSIQYNGNIQNFNTGASNVAPKYNNDLGKDLKALWAIEDGETYSPWITATLVIKDNAPERIIIQVEDEIRVLEYTGNITDVTKQKKNSTTEQTTSSTRAVYTGGNLSYHEVYDFRVIAGEVTVGGTAETPTFNVPVTRTPASTDVIEMYGTQEALDKSAVRFIAELKNTDVDGVTFEVQASRTKDDITTSGKTKIMEPVTVGYTSITETIDGEPHVVRAADGSVFVLFVIRGIDLAAYDEYTFTVSCSASGSFCEEISYTIGN